MPAKLLFLDLLRPFFAVFLEEYCLISDENEKAAAGGAYRNHIQRTIAHLPYLGVLIVHQFDEISWHF